MTSTKEALQTQRRVLLDLTYRNRLLNLPKKPSSRSITVYDELSEQVMRLLLNKKALSFSPIRAAALEDDLAEEERIQDEEEAILLQPESNEVDEQGISLRHTDTKLQTKLKSEHLQKRLLEIYYESRTMLEEQGVNVLYLALGQLRFQERAGSDEFRHAPVVLLPVVLERKSARERFVLKWSEEDLQENLSLREKLRVDFGIVLPDFPETEGFDLGSYFESIREVVARQPGWEVIDDAVQLGFFSFAKLLMFLDLDPGKWPEGKAIDQNELVAGLLGDGFAESDVGISSASAASLDDLIPVAELKHIMDCDSSQALAIEAVRRGQNIVIQGPPGTGKSQTIANLIATAVSDGKRVLFVAEKMAALEVVKRRMEKVGLGPLCLELHSNKANKKTVLEDLGRTLGLGAPAHADIRGANERLDELRTQLNDHARNLHSPVGVAQLTPYLIVGQLSKLLPKVGRPPYRLAAASAWTMAEAEKRASVVNEVCEQLPRIGNPAQNHWRGVAHPPVMRPQAEDLMAPCASLRIAVERVTDAGTALAQDLGLASPENIEETARLCTIGEQLAKAPAFDRSTISAGVWTAGIDALKEALRSGRILSDVQGRRADQVNDLAWDMDWIPQRLAIAATGTSLFRIFSGNYRQSLNQLRGVVKGTLPKTYEARLSLLDDLIAGRKAQAAMANVVATAKSAFGSVWRGHETDWDLADSILGWVEQKSSAMQGVDLREVAAGIDDKPVLESLVASAREAIGACSVAFVTAAESLRLDPSVAFDGLPFQQVPLRRVAERAAAWSGDVDGLLAWLSYAEVKRRSDELGMEPVTSSFEMDPGRQAQAVAQFWTAFYLQQLEDTSKQYPDLPKFDGRRHEAMIGEFRQWDRKRLAIAQVEAAQAHHKGMPKASLGVGNLGILRSEIARKRGHMALRKLIRICSSPIQAIKPVFMMSPLSVAQFLEPGAIEFDLLVIDEASQVEPVDALGAIARCQQIVVVGDDKQLPPTSFFSRVVGNDELDDQEEGAQAKDLESVLSLCAAKGLPQRMLQWHYRSRHESLIAVSNKEFYEGNLFIVPSPDRERRQLGLRFHYLPEGRFDRGNSYKNHAEAAAIAQAVIDHARTRPDLTLGVGAMSVRQRQAITDEIEIARRQHPELEHFISRHEHEPFFVKNLENIQGDERDVILISIGYGRSKSDDKMYQNFGPLNADGGHRRLNVLITRARERCEVFSSIVADDIRVDERTRLGVIALKTFLKYAQSGDLGVPLMTGRGADSPFEEAVQDLLAKHGFQVDNQVGVAGFFIDLAIVDPDVPGRYLIGLECDGATYHSAPSARDRDRLRQEILEAHGWNIHRIWSTDWFQRSQAETDRLLNAVAAAKATRTAAELKPVAPPAPAASEPVRRIAPAAQLDAPSMSQPYRQVQFVPENSDLAPHEVPIGSMACTVERIIQAEGPIHEEEIVARVRDLWGLGRAGNRIQAAVRDALVHAARKGNFSVEGDCYRINDASVPVRDRSEATSRTLKKPELLPPQELREAILGLVREAHGVRREEIALAVSRMLGFMATSQQLRERIEQQVDLLLVKTQLAEEGVILTCESPDRTEERNESNRDDQRRI